MLGRHIVPGRPTNLDNSWARAYCVCSRFGWGLFGHFFSRLSFLFFLPLCETARYRLKYCLKGPLNPNNQLTKITRSHISYLSLIQVLRTKSKYLLHNKIRMSLTNNLQYSIEKVRNRICFSYNNTVDLQWLEH